MTLLCRNWKDRVETTIPLLVTKTCSRPGLMQLPYWGCPRATRNDNPISHNSQATRNDNPTKMPPFLWEKGSHPIQKAVFLTSQEELQSGDQRSENMGPGARRHLWP